MVEVTAPQPPISFAGERPGLMCAHRWGSGDEDATRAATAPASGKVAGAGCPQAAKLQGRPGHFTIKVAIVTAIWPGATAEEMQDQVSDRIEKKLQELPYFDRVQTYTKPSFTAMQVVFRDHTPAKEVPQLFYQLRK